MQITQSKVGKISFPLIFFSMQDADWFFPQNANPHSKHLCRSSWVAELYALVSNELSRGNSTLYNESTAVVSFFDASLI